MHTGDQHQRLLAGGRVLALRDLPPRARLPRLRPDLRLVQAELRHSTSRTRGSRMRDQVFTDEERASLPVDYDPRSPEAALNGLRLISEAAKIGREVTGLLLHDETRSRPWPTTSASRQTARRSSWTSRLNRTWTRTGSCSPACASNRGKHSKGAVRLDRSLLSSEESQCGLWARSGLHGYHTAHGGLPQTLSLEGASVASMAI